MPIPDECLWYQIYTFPLPYNQVPNISCLLKLSAKEIRKGHKEIDLKYKKKIKFIDTLLCISFIK